MDFIILSGMPSTFLQRGIGAYQIAHHLRTFGYTCQVIEFTQHFSYSELINTLDRLITKQTLGVGVSTTWFDQTLDKDPIRQYLTFKAGLPQHIVDILSWVKKEHPHVKTIAGGALTKAYKDSGLFDYTIFSYAEDKIIQLANHLSGRNDSGSFNIQNLEHRFIDHDLIIPGESLPIEISRGCIFKCSFCSFPLNGKKKFDYIRTPKLIAEEMLYNYENYGTTSYLFTDDTFNDTTSKVQQIHDEIIKLPFKINFISYLRLDLLNAHREQIPLLKNMGLKVAAFGVETFNDASAKIIGKGMSGDKAKDFLDELYNTHWGDDVRIHCYMMSGLPKETLASSRKAMDWLHSRPFSSLFSTFSLYKNSEDVSLMASKPDQYGYNIDNQGKWYTDIHTQQQSELFHAKHFAMMVKRKVYYEGFGVFGAFTHYGVDQALKLTWDDVVSGFDSIRSERTQMVDEYKRRLRAILP